MNSQPADTPAFEYVDRPQCVCGYTFAGGERAVEKHFDWGPVRFVDCAQCGSKVQRPGIATRSLAAWYDSSAYQSAKDGGDGPYLDYLAEEDQRRREGERRYRADLHAHLPAASRVLEVGCATGSLLAAIHAAGHRVSGVELSARFARSAAELNGIDVAVADFLDYDAAPASFDAVLMLGTVSNLPEVDQHLTRAHALLRPGGLLYFNVPVCDSLVASLYGTRYWMYAPSVATFLSREGVRRVLERTGYSLQAMRHDRQSPTVGKLLSHLRLKPLFPLARRLGIAELQPPLGVPLPGIHAVWAHPR